MLIYCAGSRVRHDYDNYFGQWGFLNQARSLMTDIYAKAPFLARIYRVVKRLPQGAHVLDIGAGEGHFLRIVRLLRPDLKLTAVDLANCLKYAELSDVAFFTVDLDAGAALPKPEGAAGFDLIVCQHVIEHIHTPSNLFRMAFDALKPGGELYVECPDVRWTLIPHIPFITGWRGGLNFWDDPTHLRPYSRPSLRKLAEMGKFSDIRVFYVRKWGHLLALPLALFTLNDDYKVAVLHPLLGLWCGVLARRPT